MMPITNAARLWIGLLVLTLVANGCASTYRVRVKAPEEVWSVTRLEGSSLPALSFTPTHDGYQIRCVKIPDQERAAGFGYEASGHVVRTLHPGKLTTVGCWYTLWSGSVPAGAPRERPPLAVMKTKTDNVEDVYQELHWGRTAGLLALGLGGLAAGVALSHISNGGRVKSYAITSGVFLGLGIALRIGDPVMRFEVPTERSDKETDW